MDRTSRISRNTVLAPASAGRDSVPAQFARFVLAGGSANAVYALAFLGLGGLGEQVANGTAAVLSAALANELHRRFTFRAHGQVGWRTAQWQGGWTLAAGLVASGAALAWLGAGAAGGGPLVPLLVAATVHGSVGLARFAVLRWLFGRPTGTVPVPSAVPSPVALPADRSVAAAAAA